MTARSNTLDMARGIGTLGAGLAAGVFLNVSLVVYPGMKDVKTLSPHDLLRIWSKTLDRGAYVGGTLVTLSSAAFLLSAYISTPFPTLLTLSAPLRFIAAHRQLMLTLSGLSILATGPWTRIVMLPTIKQLKQEEKMADSQPDIVMQDTRGLIDKWLALHRMRVALTSLAFVGGLMELLAC